MRRLLTLALVALFAGVALAGCAGNQDDNGGGTDTPGGTPTAGGGGGAPDASMTASTLSPSVGEEVTFRATGASEGDTVTWQFGDGTTGTGQTATHAYDISGSYIVRLEVARGDTTVNNEATLTFLSVSAPQNFSADMTADTAAPVADMVVDRQVVQKGTAVVVNGSTSYAWGANPDFDATLGVTPDNLPVAKDAAATENLTFEWNWGDGSATSTGKEATHTYADTGVYSVVLTVTAPNGQTGKEAATILVLGEAPQVGGYKHKDLFVTATISGPQSFDPGFDYETSGGHVIEQVYETLFGTERGNTDKIVPVLAAEVPTVANGGINADGTVYTIKIRDGVKFHDGTSLDAEAVKFSLDRAILMNDPNSGAAVLAPILKGAEEYRANSQNTRAERNEWLALEAVKVIDPMTVQITMDQPNAAFFQRLAFYGTSIVSPTAFKACHEERRALWGVCQTSDGLPPASDEAGGTITRDPWADTNTVGTGPFELRRWLPGDRVIMDRNAEYWGEQPKLKTVIIQYVDDLNTRILMFKSGDADEIYIPSDQLDRVRPSIEGIARFVPADTLIVDGFFYNYDVKDSSLCPTVNGQPDCDMFQDVHVRKAFAYAFDYDAFFNDIWKGRAKDLAGVIPRGMPGYDPSLEAYKQNTELAKQHLEQSVAANGFSVDCYWNSGNTVRKGACELMKKNLEELMPGQITVNSRELPFNTLLDKMQTGQLPFWILGWSPDYIATDDYIYPFYHSEGTYPVSMNFHNETLDAEIEAALAMTDPEAQAAAFKEINRKAHEQLVYMPLDQRTQTHVERTYVQGYYYSPLHSGSPNTGDYSVVYKS